MKVLLASEQQSCQQATFNGHLAKLQTLGSGGNADRGQTGIVYLQNIKQMHSACGVDKCGQATPLRLDAQRMQKCFQHAEAA